MIRPLVKQTPNDSVAVAARTHAVGGLCDRRTMTSIPASPPRPPVVGSASTNAGCCFLPPYLLRQVAETTPGSHPAATLAVDERLRSRRQAATAATGPQAPDTSGNRVVCDAENTEQLPGQTRRGADDPPTGDAAVDEAHDYSGVAWDLFAEVFSRASVDGRATPITVTVHYGTNYDNAFWDGSQLVFGDGDAEIFDRFTKPLDVMAHEFTHGVTQFGAGLTYQGQSGALNESVSDAFAAMAKQRRLGQDAGAADWLIGEGLFRPGVSARALRSMTEPGTAYDDPRLGKDPQVGSMTDYVDTTDDNGGVHINSGIPNRAFALAAIAVGGPSWEKTGRVWYDALTGGEVGADADFAAFAQATVASASRLFADDAAVIGGVRGAWEGVGVLSPAAGSGDGAASPSSPDAASSQSGTTPGSGPESDAPPREQGAERVGVRRSGGFAGGVRRAELPLDSDPYGPELRTLLSQIGAVAMGSGEPQPDRFVYTVTYRSWQVTVAEPDLTPELSRVVQIVLDQGDDPDR